MDIGWDEAKRLANIEKHAIDFYRAKEIWNGFVLEVPSLQVGHGETRIIALGALEDRIIAVVFTRRRRTRRIISARRARTLEEAIYKNALGRGSR